MSRSTPVPNRPTPRTSADADSIGIGAPFRAGRPRQPQPIFESFPTARLQARAKAPPKRSEKRLRRKRRRKGMVMRATLRQAAPDSYYGQWLRRFRGESDRMRRSIAQGAPPPRGLIHRLLARSAEAIRTGRTRRRWGCVGRALRLSTRFRSLLPSSRGLGRGPLKAKTRVRIP